MPRLQLSPGSGHGVASAAIRARTEHEDAARGAEAVEGVDQLGLVGHDWALVTAASALLVSSLPDELDPLDLPEELDRLDAPSLLEPVLVDEEGDGVLVETALVATARFALAANAGSCPEASCTYTARNAALKTAAANAATARRIRRARRRIAVRRARASALPLSCSDPVSEVRRVGAPLTGARSCARVTPPGRACARAAGSPWARPLSRSSPGTTPGPRRCPHRASAPRP
jgi:hypothetical protein